MEDNDLTILLEAALDLAKSLTNIQQQMKTMQTQLQGHTLKLVAELDKAASRARLNNDLKTLKTLNIKVAGQLDSATTRKQVKEGLGKLREQQIKIQGVLDRVATNKNLKDQIQQLSKIEATASVRTDGAEQIENLRRQMDAASTSSTDMAAKLYLARTAIQVLRRAAAEAVETVKELDAAATNLAIITGGQNGETYKLLEEYNDLARKLGATTIQISDAAASWLRQGKDAAETAELIEQSIMLSKVAMIDSETATKNLTSAMRGYGLAVEDVSGIVDKLAALDSKAAVTASDLAVAMSQTASSANIGGVSMNRLLGYLSAVQEVTQRSAETIGQSFKTIFARMGNIKLGHFFDDEGEDLSDVESSLRHYGIALRNAEGDFRDFGAVLDDVYAKWDKFRAVDQRAIAQAFAGTWQQENFLVLMQNYGKALEYAGVAADSAGVALQKFGAYQDSISAKSAEFTAAMESLVMDAVDPEFVKDLIAAGTAVVEFVDRIGLLKAALISLSVGGTLKGISMIGRSFKNVSHNVLGMGEAINILRRMGDVSALSGEQISRLGTLTRGLSNDQLKLVLTSQQLSSAQMKAILMASGLTEAEASQTIQTLGLATAEGAATGATWSLSAAVTGLGASIKSAFLSNPIGMIMLAVSALVMAVEAVNNAQEEARRTAMEAADAAATLSDEVADLTSRYLELSEAVKTDTSVKEDLLSVQNELIGKLGIEQTRVQELTDQYGSLTDAIKAAALEKLKEAERDIRGGGNAYEDDLLKAGKASWGIDSISISRSKQNGLFSTSAETRSEQIRMYKALKALEDAGLINSGSYSTYTDDNGTKYSQGFAFFAGMDENLDTIEGVLNTYEELGKMLDVVTDAAGSNNLVYETLYDTYNKMSSAVSNYHDSISQLNNNLAQQYMLQGLIGQEIPSTQEAFDQYRQSVIDAAMESGKFVGTDQDIVNSIDGILQKQTEFASFYADDLVGAAEKTGTYTAKLQELPMVLSELQSAYNILQSAENGMAGGGGLSADTIKALADAQENYLNYLYEENGVVKLNTEAWKENANAKMQREMDEIQAEIDAIERENAAIEEQIREKEALRLAALEAQDLTSYYSYYSAIDSLNGKISANNELIAENQGKLAMYSALYGSITGDMDAYTAALQNFSNVANTIDTMTNSFQALANLQAEVADGFTMSLERALEFAKVYPEIMNSAQVCADGQIQLNEGVVNSFIEGKKAELDAQIDALVAQLEAEKAADQAKLESAQVQLELAKAVAEGEGEITKELAEYRINAGNAVAQALIEAGIDETTAFKLAATAMAQNAEEFDRVAMEVCTDVNGNFNQAAFDLAQTMYKNLTNVKTDLASVAEQAHQTAQAIAGIADGTVKGSSSVRGGSGGGVDGSGIKLNLTSGSFKGSTYTYTAKESSLEDFISQIELDISNYQNAITQIDGQIAALQALKNTPLKSFEGKGVGAKSGSGSSSKEVEEYISDIDKYRDAVEALRKAQEEATRIEGEIENAGSYEKKIALEKELVETYKAEQAALHDLNDARDATISESVEALKALGFAVEYNADTNELWISNMEHLNELTADSKGNYNSLQEATNALRKNTEDLIGTITSLNDENRKGSEQWLELQKSIIKATVAQYEYALQVKKNSIMLAEDGLENAINSKSLADVKKFSAAIISEYQAMQRTLHKEAEYYRALGYSETSDEVSKLSDLWWDYADNIKKVKEQVVDYLIEIVDAAHDSVDEIQNVSDALHDAADEFAANDGFLTVDTIQALLKLCPQYMQMLKAENGLWEINEERINAVVAARTQQLAVENAMSYVERLKLAAQQGSIEDLNNLCFATTEATASTWGLVYAELELMHTMGELNDSQYQAALHNIQAMQDLAENAIQNIGKATGAVAKNLEETRKQLEATKNGLQDLLDELKDMQDGAGDLVDYVMDMLRHRIRQQIDLLEEMKDKYSEIIDLKKKSLDAAKDEHDYQKTIAKKLKEMAKLQERINALALDDSRSAQAERAKLLEQMAELQKDLSETQANKSIDAQKDALDQMEEDYHKEKDEEIKILEDSISSTQKLYDLSINYIRENWNTLFSELIDWNTQWGTSLNSEITTAFEAAQAAAERYGDFVSAIMGSISAEIDSITAQIKALNNQISNLNTSTSSSGSGIGVNGAENKNTTVGAKTTSTSPSDEDMVRTIVGKMKECGAAWSTSNDKATKDALHQKAVALAQQLDQYGVHADFRGSDGTWWITRDELNQSNVGKPLHSCYHTGGFVGDEPLKPNER